MLIDYQDAYTSAMAERVEPLGYVLKRVQAALRRSMDQALGEHDLSMAQYAMLSNLDHAGPLTNAELARRSFVTPQTSIRIVLDLEAAGFVERRPDRSNRRLLNASLTAAGRAQLAVAEVAANEVEARMLDGFSETERERFRTLLERSASNLDGPVSR